MTQIEFFCFQPSTQGKYCVSWHKPFTAQALVNQLFSRKAFDTLFNWILLWTEYTIVLFRYSRLIWPFSFWTTSRKWNTDHKPCCASEFRFSHLCHDFGRRWEVDIGRAVRILPDTPAFSLAQRDWAESSCRGYIIRVGSQDSAQELCQVLTLSLGNRQLDEASKWEQ